MVVDIRRDFLLGSSTKVEAISTKLSEAMHIFFIHTLLLKEALEKAKRDAKVLKTSFCPPHKKDML